MNWLILSYRANIDGSACSQHLDDRLPELLRHGIMPVLLSGPIGASRHDIPHFRVPSPAPSGLRFEWRHLLRQRFGHDWRYRLASLLLLPLLPFYALEKLLLPLESEWSWCFTASWQGLRLCRRYRPQVLYSTGGGVGAHLAAWYIARRTGICWIAETQDPLVHDQDWRKGRFALRLYGGIERLVLRSARCTVFLTRGARDNAEQRTGIRGAVIYPGAHPARQVPSRRQPDNSLFHLGHFGTLSGTRNLLSLLQGITILGQRHPDWPGKIRLELFGSCDEATTRKAEELGLASLLHHRGLRPRREALDCMAEMDCLLLVQDTVFFSSETIPSKVYEYLQRCRPVLALVYHNDELTALLRDRGHCCAPVDNAAAVALSLEQIMDLWHKGGQAGWRCAAASPTVAEAVEQLLLLSRGQGRA